ncbi:MAG: hypothetical protein RJA22_3016 [Verrucomicrobiota bacterium]
MHAMVQRMRARMGGWTLGVATLVLLSGCAGPESGPSTQAPRDGAALYVKSGCAQCHGAQAEGLQAAQGPRLGGREDWFIRRQIEEFQRRERGRDDSKETGYLPPEGRTQFMHPVVDRLGGRDIRALAAHLAGLEPPPLPPSKLGDASRGRALYAGCAECHGLSAEGNESLRAPRLSGQHDWYLFAQLRDFRMGWRGADSADPHVKLMRSRLDLDDQALRDLAAYLATQPRIPAAAGR